MGDSAPLRLAIFLAYEMVTKMRSLVKEIKVWLT